MSDNSVFEWVINWFADRNPAKDIDIGMDYYAEGLVDSFGVVELVSELEDVFDITLTDEELKSDAFRNIGGLIEIISNRMQAG